MLKLFLFIAVLTISAVNLQAAEKKRPAGPAVTVTTKQDEVLINARRARLAEISAIEKAAGSRADPLRSLLADKDPLVRGEAAAALGRVKDPASFAALEDALKSGDEHTRWGAIKGLSVLGDRKAVPLLLAALGHQERNTRWKAAQALGEFKDARAVDALAAAARSDKYRNVRLAAIEALSAIGGNKAASALESLGNDADPEIRAWAVAGAAKLRK